MDQTVAIQARPYAVLSPPRSVQIPSERRERLSQALMLNFQDALFNSPILVRGALVARGLSGFAATFAFR